MMKKMRKNLYWIAMLTVLFGPQAQAAVAATSFYLDWSGTLWGNQAEARAVLTINNALFPNPGEYVFLSPGVEVTDFSMAVTGAGAGNGHFQLADFDAFVWNTLVELDLSRELVGQFTGNAGWGYAFDGSAGDFNLIAAEGSNAPNLDSSFLLATSNNLKMNLVSFRPVPLPAAFWLFGSMMAAFIGVGGNKRRTITA